jgi:UTP--glucose-1-phosphate uridylyltransferase
MQVTKAVIPAAGLGTRFLPITKALPKEMLPICDKPTIQYIIEEAVNSGITDILIITGRGKWPSLNYYDRSPELEAHLKMKGNEEQLEKIINLSKMANIYYRRQPEPLGLGHAVHCAKSFIGKEPFAVLLGDDIIKSEVPATKQLIDIAKKTHSSVIGIREVKDTDVNKYGIITPGDQKDNVHRVINLVEKPSLEKAPSRLAIMGRYVLTSSIFSYLEQIPQGAGGEYQLTDAINLLSADEKVYGCEFEGIRFDAGDKLGFLTATVEYSLDSPDIGENFAKYLKDLYERRQIKEG